LAVFEILASRENKVSLLPFTMEAQLPLFTQDNDYRHYVSAAVALLAGSFS
jgi:hypothetical protein